MKKATKLKIWGFSQLGFGAVLIVLSTTNNDGVFGGPNPAFLIPGVFVAFIALPIIISGFGPQIAKFSAKLEQETYEHAGEDIHVATKQKADTIVPAVTPAIKEAVKEIKNKKSIEELLEEAKKLLDNGLITEEEYQLMRKNILGI